jgi:Leucine-rich repeat (LRR) protein
MVICDLLELRFLDLSDNLISDLPPTIARLQGLESLLLVYNRITRLPDSICGMVYFAFARCHCLLQAINTLKNAFASIDYVWGSSSDSKSRFGRNRKSIRSINYVEIPIV